ncbi:MAG: hypothetical protein JRF61_09060 [Deltaproteobacteria bacterium]|jgi:hypothetical protein|nr:hypothetical protein [Deltaproteobacteria bacterium]
MGAGISAATAGLVEGNTVILGRDAGIVVRNGAVVSLNSILGNGGTGIDSASNSSGGSLVVDNSVSGNGSGSTLHAGDAYARKVLAANATDLPTDQVSGGVQLGTGSNLCAGALCP